MIYNSLIMLCFMSLFYIMKKINKKMYAPSVLFTFYWMINIIAAIIIFGYDYQWMSFSLYYILFMCAIFFVVESYFWKNKRDIPNEKKIKLINKVNSRKFLIKGVLTFSTISGFIYVYFLLSSSGYNISVFSSMDSLISASHTYTEIRYGGGEENTTIFSQLMLSTTYFGWLFSGFVYPFALKDKDRVTRVFCFPIFIPTILTVLISNGKTGLVFGLILWVTGYLLANQFTNIKVNFALIRKVLIISIIAWCVFFIAFYIRYGGAEFNRIFNRIIVYAIGHIPSFDEWFKVYPLTLLGETHGSSTFNALFRMLGLPIIDTDSRNLITETKFGFTNVHTLFSNILLDFGVLGSILFFIIMGIVSGLILEKIGKKKISAINLTVTALLYFCILYSFLISPLKYSSFIFALVEFYLVLRYILCNKIIKIKLK